MAGWTTAYKNVVQDSGSPATIYISLYVGDPTTTGGAELTATGYARQSCSLGTSTGGTVSNTADVVFSATGTNLGTPTYAGWHSASTGGTVYGGSALSTGRAMVTGATLTFTTGAIDLTIT